MKEVGATRQDTPRCEPHPQRVLGVHVFTQRGVIHLRGVVTDGGDAT